MPRKVRRLFHRLRRQRFLISNKNEDGRILLFEDGVNHLSYEPLTKPFEDDDGFDFSSCSLTASISDVLSDDSGESSDDDTLSASQALNPFPPCKKNISEDLLLSCAHNVTESNAENSKGFEVRGDIVSTIVKCNDPRRSEFPEEDKTGANITKTESAITTNKDGSGCTDGLSFINKAFDLNVARVFSDYSNKEPNDDKLGSFPTRPLSIVERMTECYDGSVHIFDNEEMFDRNDSASDTRECGSPEYPQSEERNKNSTNKDYYVKAEIETGIRKITSHNDRIGSFNGVVHVFHDNLPALYEEPTELETTSSEDSGEAVLLNEIVFESSVDEDNIRARWERSVKMMASRAPNYNSVAEAVSSGSVVGIGAVEIAEI